MEKLLVRTGTGTSAAGAMNAAGGGALAIAPDDDGAIARGAKDRCDSVTAT